MFKVKITGKGVHGAMPHRLLTCFGSGSVVTALQMLRREMFRRLSRLSA
jgi:hypothetical protein